MRVSHISGAWVLQGSGFVLRGLNSFCCGPGFEDSGILGSGLWGQDLEFKVLGLRGLGIQCFRIRI